MNEGETFQVIDGRSWDRPGPDLSEPDERHLASLEAKLQLVRDFVAEVVRGYATGFFLHGDGGIGKSYTVLGVLEELRADYKLYNSRMTGRGLFETLAKFPDSVHVLEDMEPITRDRGAQGVLRSALWGQRTNGGGGRMERPVTWSTYRKEHVFIFGGGIIMIANRPLDALPELMALRTRIASMHLRANDGELTALMRSVALKGFAHEGQVMTPAECLEVCEFVIAESRSLHRALDMRLLANGCMHYLACQDYVTGCDWKDLVATGLKERPTTFAIPPVPGTRDERMRTERAIAREIAATTHDRGERLRMWKERTGKGTATYYRHLT